MIRRALGAVVTVFIVGCGYGGAPTSSPFAIASGRVGVLEKGSNSTLLSSRRQDARANYKIYVVSLFTRGETFNPNGERIHPTLNSQLASGVAVDKNGKIYVTREEPNGNGTLLTFLPDGTPTTPTIYNLVRPVGVAVDANGKIYVASDDGIGSFTAVGKPTNPWISAAARSIAIDKSGKIYVATNNGVDAFTPHGKPTTPTIAGSARAVAVDGSGKIYVAENYPLNRINTYTSKGAPTAPTITAGIDDPVSIAIDPSGKILVVNFGTYLSGPFSVTSYRPNGNRTTPTITNNLTDPVGVAIH